MLFRCGLVIVGFVLGNLTYLIRLDECQRVARSSYWFRHLTYLQGLQAQYTRDDQLLIILVRDAKRRHYSLKGTFGYEATNIYVNSPR